MQFIKSLLCLSLFLIPFLSFSQTTFLTQGSKDKIILERLEILGQTDSALNFSKIQPLSRKAVIQKAEAINIAYDQIAAEGKRDDENKESAIVNALSKTDKYNLDRLLMNNSEWVSDNKYKFVSKKPIGKNFYQSPSNLIEVNKGDFFLAINPVIQYVLSKEKDNDQNLFLNTRGVSVRGRIADKIGFAAYVSENQERDPMYVQQWVAARQAVPGAGFYKDFKDPGGLDYFDARGYISFNATKYIDISFGYDRNFIGNGQRSLFLSDFSNNTLFLKLNTRIWKFNYQNLFMELVPSHRVGADILLPKKYAAMHHLDVNIGKSMNIGLFEGVVFGRKDHFEFGYLNPVIFYRSIEQQNGSFDNAVAGIDFKANVARRFQVYGQLMLDEFKLNELKDNNGWWANKWGIQAGVKYVNAFNIKNLDLQLEHNRVRPFTYSHRDSIADYSHYNQPLAHPLGANFQELIGISRYQPAPRWQILGKLIYFKQGNDMNNESFGSNIFLPNVPPYRKRDYGYNIGSGLETNTLLGSFLLSYEWKENLFFEVSALYRKMDVPSNSSMSTNTSVISAGVRWNMHRREFDF
jgi:hypothetical protein